MNIYTKLNAAEITELEKEAFKYPATTKSLVARLTEEGNIYNLKLGDVWELAKLTGNTVGGSVDLYELTKRFV